MASTYNGKPAGDINHAMKQYLPETNGCTYADYPMEHARWYSPGDITPDGLACFLATDTELPQAQGAKQGYVWGQGPAGFGYYHLMTQAAHQLLYRRITRRRVDTGTPEPFGCCCFGGEETDPRQKMPTGVSRDDIDDLRLLQHARSVASIPNDMQAGKDALAKAQQTAQKHYHIDQNIQLVNGMVR